MYKQMYSQNMPNASRLPLCGKLWLGRASPQLSPGKALARDIKTRTRQQMGACDKVIQNYFVLVYTFVDQSDAGRFLGAIVAGRTCPTAKKVPEQFF